MSFAVNGSSILARLGNSVDDQVQRVTIDTANYDPDAPARVVSSVASLDDALAAVDNSIAAVSTLPTRTPALTLALSSTIRALLHGLQLTAIAGLAGFDAQALLVDAFKQGTIRWHERVVIDASEGRARYIPPFNASNNNGTSAIDAGIKPHWSAAEDTAVVDPRVAALARRAPAATALSPLAAPFHSHFAHYAEDPRPLSPSPSLSTEGWVSELVESEDDDIWVCDEA